MPFFSHAKLECNKLECDWNVTKITYEQIFFVQIKASMVSSIEAILESNVCYQQLKNKALIHSNQGYVLKDLACLISISNVVLE